MRYTAGYPAIQLIVALSTHSLVHQFALPKHQGWTGYPAGYKDQYQAGYPAIGLTVVFSTNSLVHQFALPKYQGWTGYPAGYKNHYQTGYKLDIRPDILQ